MCTQDQEPNPTRQRGRHEESGTQGTMNRDRSRDEGGRKSERTRRTGGSGGRSDEGGRNETDGRAPPAARRPAPAQPPAPDTPGHISPPDGAQGGRVRRSEARGFHRESGKNPLFQFQIIRLLFSFEGNTKKGNRIPSDCLYILYVLSFLHTFPFSIFAKNKKSMKKRKLICTIVGIILGAPLGLVIGYILRKYILLLLQ